MIWGKLWATWTGGTTSQMETRPGRWWRRKFCDTSLPRQFSAPPPPPLFPSFSLSALTEFGFSGLTDIQKGRHEVPVRVDEAESSLTSSSKKRESRASIPEHFWLKNGVGLFRREADVITEEPTNLEFLRGSNCPTWMAILDFEFVLFVGKEIPETNSFFKATSFESLSKRKRNSCRSRPMTSAHYAWDHMHEEGE